MVISISNLNFADFNVLLASRLSGQAHALRLVLTMLILVLLLIMTLRANGRGLSHPNGMFPVVPLFSVGNFLSRLAARLQEPRMRICFLPVFSHFR